MLTDRQTDRQIAVIIPYFGELPNYFDLWVQSAKANKNIDIFIFSDQQQPKALGENFHWNRVPFKEVRQRIQNLVNFKICLNEPYKLVDFKPTYGAAFADYINDYKYWAFGDIDTIWGNLNIILDRIDESYDKILDLGHLTIVRNNSEMNYLWKRKISGAWTYQDAFKSSLIYHFDEGGGFAPIAKEYGCRIYSEGPGEMSFGDLIPGKATFQLAYDWGEGRSPHIFKWENGEIIGYWVEDGKVKSRPFSYIHLQKKKNANRY